MWSQRILYDGKALTVGSTDKLTLPDAGDLSALLIGFSGTLASDLYDGEGGKWRMRDWITDVVLKVNGTAELCHISARELAAFHFYDLGIMPADKTHNEGAASVTDYLLLNFGRRPCDEDIGVQLGSYENPELWITNNATTSIIASYSVDVVALMRWKGGAGFPRGYLHKKNFKSWTGVRAEEESTKLPTEHVCRRILLESLPELDSANLYKTNMFNPMYNVKLSLRSGSEIFYDGDPNLLARMAHFQKGAYVETQMVAGFVADVGFFTGVGYHFGPVAGQSTNSGAVATTFTTIEAGRTDATAKLETNCSAEPPPVWARGICPENCMAFLFDHDPNPATWLDLAGEKQVQLDILTRDHADADAGTNSILVERLLPHGKGA